MFKGLGNIASLLKNAQNIGGKMTEIAESLKRQRVEGSAGGQMVKVTANGLSQVISIEIDPLIKQTNDWDMLQDLLPAAVNDAMGKAKQLHMEAMKEVTGGFEMPGLDEAMKKFNLTDE